MIDKNRKLAKTKDYDLGYMNGIVDSCWTCGDCGNMYEPTIDECPNHLLDQAIAAYGSHDA